MLAEVRKCAEANDIKGLRYIFVDCLDVDPTFEKYKEDYNYCKNIPGFFDAHVNLNGIISNEERWNSQYWDQLKLDLMKNFSKERFEHMIQVAKVVYADKIVRLVSERKISQTVKTDHRSANTQNTGSHVKTEEIPETILDVELQDKRIAEKKRALEEENRRIEAEQAAQRARIEAAKRDSFSQSHAQTVSSGSKKVLGIVLGIIVIVAVMLIIAIALR